MQLPGFDAGADRLHRREQARTDGEQRPPFAT